MVDELERFAQACALALGQRNLHRLAVEDDRLTAQGHPGDIDVLTNALHRLLVWHAVETFDDLRAACAKAKDEPAVAHIVTASCGLGDSCGGAREDVEDAGADFDPLGAGGQEADLADRIDAVRFGNPDDVKTGLFVFDDLVDR